MPIILKYIDIYYFSMQNYGSLYMLLEHPFWGCLDGVMVKDVRRCSARRAHRIRGFRRIDRK